MPSKPKKIPMRMCVGCHEMKPKKELLRVVKPAEGECAIDRTGKASGRGAYICPSAECLKKAQKTKKKQLKISSRLWIVLKNERHPERSARHSSA